MKTYLVTGKYGVDLSQDLSKLGETEIISLMYNIYSLTTNNAIESIYKLKNVISVREENRAYLHVN